MNDPFTLISQFLLCAELEIFIINFHWLKKFSGDVNFQFLIRKTYISHVINDRSFVISFQIVSLVQFSTLHHIYKEPEIPQGGGRDGSALCY